MEGRAQAAERIAAPAGAQGAAHVLSARTRAARTRGVRDGGAGGLAPDARGAADGSGAADAPRLPELLAPAGGLDAALAAIAAGADALYTGLGDLDARTAAPGVTPAELAVLCALAHRRGVRVYVTLNALVRDDELPRALAAARAARDAGADALIVADLGLVALLARELPGMEAHLSTQAGAQSAAAVRWAARALGVGRVTVARELSIGEIAAAAASGVPVEAFCHGAICIGYAGACAASALRRGRSALCGDCTQPCRLSYRLEDASGAEVAAIAGDRLLCPRDYLGLRHLPALCAAGVAALKIEGRMKNPDYVFNVVGVYRRALDALARGARLDGAALDALEFELGKSFNRGFTDAYLRGRSGAELMSFERAINQGVRVGVVAARRRHEVEVELERPVEAGDTLEIHTILPADAAADVPRRWPLVPCPVTAPAGAHIRVRCKRRVEAGSPVYLTASAGVLAASEEALCRMRAEFEAVAREMPAAPVPAQASEEGRFGSAPAGKGPDGRGAQPIPSAGAQVACAASCSGRASGAADAMDGGCDGNPSAALAEDGAPSVRTAGEDLCRAPRVDERGASAPVFAVTPAEAATLLGPAPSAALNDGAPAAAPAGGPVPEVAVEAWRIDDEEDAWRPLLPRMTVLLDEVCRAADEGRARDLIASARRVICRNLAQVPLARAAGADFDAVSPLSAENACAASLLRAWGARRVWLSEEQARLRAELPAWASDVLALPAAELMVCEHCLLTAEGPCDGRCAACARRRTERYLVEASGARLPVAVDARGRTRIFDAPPSAASA